MSEACRVCRGPICPGDGVQQIWVYHHVRDGQVHTTEEPEVGHVVCANPNPTFRSLELKRWTMKTTTTDPLPARAPAHQCLVCGKAYERGDRFIPVYRALGVAHDPQVNAPNVLVAPDWETMHVRCDDPQLQHAHRVVVLS